MMDKPNRRYEMTLTLGADSIRDIQGALKSIIFDLEKVEDRPHFAVSGGPDSSYTLEIKFYPEQSHDHYFEQITEFLREKQSNV